MHTSRFKYDGKEALVHHNADWSGEAIVSYETVGHGVRLEFRCPASLLLAIGHRSAVEAIRDQIVNLLEDL